MKQRNLTFSVLCIIVITVVSVIPGSLKAQYVQPERDDTIRMFAQTPFDTLQAKQALARGKSTIKGVAFTRPPENSSGLHLKTGKKLLANKMRVVLYPVTPYLLEYLKLKDKENPKKLKFAYLTPQAYYYRLEAITNSTGEFTFPEMKPGKYYLEAVLNWNSYGTYSKYTGSGYNSYGGTTNYYTKENYTTGHADLLTKFVEVEKDGEVVEIKLK
jgi:hypothetical protein